MIRNKRILHDINIKKQEGLEIGPLTAPVVRKEDGSIFYLDHMSLEELKKKYKKEPVDLDKICPVDYVLKQNSVAKTVAGKTFDYVIASHVIEHVPDMVSWLNDLGAVLKPGGVLSLVIPDRRFTFDIQRSLTEPSEVIGAYLDKTKKFTSASLYDFAVNYAKDIDTASAWSDPEYYIKNPPKNRWTKQEAWDMCQDNLKPDVYVDSHCYVFEPESFLKILLELTELGLLQFELAYFLETQENELEFYVSLKKTTPSKKRKEAMLKKLQTAIPKKMTRSELIKQNEQLQRDLTDIIQSSSWKITQPLRKMNSFRKRPN